MIRIIIQYILFYFILSIALYADKSSLESRFTQGEERFFSRGGDVEKFPAVERHAVNITSDNSVIAAETFFSTQGHIDLAMQTYVNRPGGKHKNNVTASSRVDMKYKKDDFSIYMSLYGQQDLWDFSTIENRTERSFVRIDEVYGKYKFENSELMFGKNVRFWGALELRNIVDVFNPQDGRNDPFETDKLGVWNMAYTYYTQSGELSLIVKSGEQDRELSAFPYAYYYFPEAFEYTHQLNTESSSFRPTIYLKLDGSTDTKYAVDYSFIVQHGYDSQRYTTLDTSTLKLEENAYLVNKFMTYNTLVVGATLMKFEGVYADVQDDKTISDYYQLGIGAEHTLSQIYNDADLGLIAEYYHYGLFENDKRDDLALFEVFQNDLFLGFRYNFNQGNEASILSGVILDLEYDEEAYYLEYESRISQSFKINVDYRYLEPSKETETVYHLLQRHQRVNFKLGYYF